MKLMFKLGCEMDSFRRVQICLLLSTYRSYPGHFYDNERWIIKAYRILKDAGMLPQNGLHMTIHNSEWNRLCACWLQRFTSAAIGLKWTSNPELLEACDLSWEHITIDDFREDVNFSWHLSATTKERLAQVFVARLKMNVTMGQLIKILWKRTATEIQSIGEKPEFQPPPSSNPLSLEEVESRLQRWKQEHLSFILTKDRACTPPFEQRLLQAETITTRLIYE
jgi:hypothetical protein